MAFTYARSQDTRFVAKVEGTFGSDSSPTGGTDDVQVFDSDPIWTPEFNMIQYDPHNASNTLRKDIPGVRVAVAKVKALMVGSGTPGVATVNQFAGLAALLQGAGMTMTPVVGTPSTITFTPATVAAWKSFTAKGSSGGIHRAATGCYTNCMMEGGPETAGLECTFDIQGNFAPSTLTSVSGYTGGSLNPSPFLNIAGTITPSAGSPYSAIISSFRFNRGVTLPRILSSNSATGLQQVFPGKPRPTIELTMAADIDGSAALTIPNMETHLTASTTHALAFTVGSGSGLSCAFSFPQLQLLNLNFERGDQHIVIRPEYKVQHATNDSEFSITIS